LLHRYHTPKTIKVAIVDVFIQVTTSHLKRWLKKRISLMHKDSERPRVGVIIPTYNSSSTLKKCLASVLAQTYSFNDIVVVDNFSSDSTTKIAKEFGATVIRQKCNSALARNIGIAYTSSQYILFLDSDQVLSPSVIDECVKKCQDEAVKMIRIPEAFIGSGFWGSCSATWKNYYQKVEEMYPNRENITSGEPRFFSRDSLTTIGMLNSGLQWGEDYDLYIRLKEIKAKEAKCKSKIYHIELESVMKIMTKNLRYGKFMPVFVQRTKKQVFPPIVRHAMLTLKDISREVKSLPIIVGCTILLIFKTYSIMTGLVVGLFRKFTK
jgi:glycosyltransferase involved in cell wall biosynthesis